MKQLLRHLLLAFIIAGTVALTVSSVWSRNNANKQMNFMQPDRRIWKGHIKIKRTGSADVKTDHSSQGNIKKSSYSRQVSEELDLDVCGPAGALYVRKVVKHSLKDVTKEKEEIRYAKTNCGMPEEAMKHNVLYRMKHYKPDIKHPGNSSYRKSNKTTTLYNAKALGPMEKYASASFQKMPGGRYVIRAGHTWYTTTSGEEKTSETNMCTGKTKNNITRLVTFDLSLGNKGGTNTRPANSSSTDTDKTIVIVPMPWMIAFEAQGNDSLSNDSISGRHEEKDKNGQHGYKETTVSTWDLKADDPCPDVYNSLLIALAGAEAYADSGLRKSASNCDEYESDVYYIMYKKVHGYPPPPPRPPGGGNDMYVGADCKVHRREIYEREIKQACRHPIIFEAELHHEQQHVAECRDDHAKFTINSRLKKCVAIRGQSEVTAYLFEANELLEWLRDNCPGKYDLAKAEARIQKIEAMNAGWHCRRRGCLWQ